MLRIIYNVAYDHPSKPLFMKDNIMPIHDLYAYRLITKYITEVKNNVSFIAQLASLQKRNFAYATRNTDIWHIHSFRTGYGQHMLRNTLPHLLNLCQHYNLNLQRTRSKDLRHFVSLISGRAALSV